MQTNWVVRCACAVAATVLTTQMSTSRAGAQQDIAGGETVADVEIEQRTKFKELTGKPASSRDEVIDELREEKRKIREGRRWGLDASDEEVGRAYAQMATRMGRTAEQLTQDLAQRGIDADTLKHRIRADIAWRGYQSWQRFQPANQNSKKRGPLGDYWIPGELERRFGR